MSRPALLFLTATLVTACSGAPATPATAPSPAPSSAAATSASALTAAPSPAAGASAGVADPEASEAPTAPEPVVAESAAPAPPEPPPPTPSYVTHPVVFDPPYKLGSRPHPADKDLAREDDQELARWNEGGRRERWHPQPRVMVDNVRVQGKVSANAVLREARKNGYWPIRRCYDAGLPNDQELHGKLTMRFTLRSSGKVAGPVIAGTPTLPDKDVLACLRKAFRGMDLVRPRRGDAKVTLDIALHPGDAPMKAIEEPPHLAGAGTIDTSVVQGLIAAGTGAVAQQCYESGLQRVPGLWGRLALRVDVTLDGTITSLVETESTFPDPQTSACILDAMRAIRLPPPRGGDVCVVVPIRMGNPG